MLECALLNIFCQAASKVPVVIQNVTNHNVTLLPKHVIGELSAAVCLGPLSSEQSSLPHSGSSDEGLGEQLTFDLNNPLLGEENASQTSLIPSEMSLQLMR